MRILIVDDEYIYCDYLRKILEARGHTVATADCGMDAIKTGIVFRAERSDG